MAKKMGSLFAELSQEKEELDSVISIMKDGLLVLDHENRIVLSNPSFREIVKTEVVPGKFYWESFRENAFFELVEIAGKTTAAFMRDDLEIRGRHYRVNVSHLGKKQQKLYVFQDITESRTLENLKKDFIANVSHELRTPLTAIKGFVETLGSEEKDSDKLHYLTVINRHTDRLINIVNDLLVISELEQKKRWDQLSSVRIDEILANLALLFQPRAQEKGIQFRLELPDALPAIQADGFRLEQVFQNLMDNALKYTDKGTILVTAEVRQDQLAVTVSDTGIGMPEEVLPRIFERFYVVDKSRSRQTGGTGLGLSIVKHIVQEHKGNIEVQSRVGLGSTFTVTLPLF
jgi:two-component system phosphate regulon sensor histidine kinase PhoR